MIDYFINDEFIQHLIINLQICMRLLLGLVLVTAALAAYNQNLAINHAKLAAITHCSTQQIQSWSCRICKDYPYLKNVTQIENTNTQISGFIGYDQNKNSIVISWRGTTVAQNWVSDADFRLMDYKLDSRCTGCKIHAGFFNAYLSVSTKVLDKLSSLLTAYPTATIEITGHSLGGALALVTALQLNKNYGAKIKQLYVYGCPRIGNSNLAQFLHSLIPQIYRVIHYKDIVPHLPPHDLSYLHPAYEVFYDEQMKLIKVCNQSGEDQSCSNGLAPLYSFDDHTLYWVKTDSSIC